MRKILLLEDDPVTQKLVQHALNGEFEVICCSTISDAEKKIEKAEDFSAVIIDRSLPDGDGISVCFKMRQNQQSNEVPVIFLSSANSETDKVGAFFAGADDYITKPFSLMELKARVQARLKKRATKLFAGQLEVELDSHRAFFREVDKASEIVLTRTEFKILSTLMQSMDQVFSREHLLDRVWGNEISVSDRVVDSHISHLRKKIAHAGVQLESLRGEGYRLTLNRSRQNQPAS